MPMSWGSVGVSGTKIMLEKQVCFDIIYALQKGTCFVCGDFMPMDKAIELHHTEPSEYKTTKYYDYVTDIETRFKLAHRKCHNEEHKRLGLKRPRPKMTKEERKARQKEKRRLYRLENPLPPRLPRTPFVPWNKGLKLGPLSQEHKLKISVAKSGANCSPETRRKLSEAAKASRKEKPGRPQSEETKRKLSEIMKAIGLRPPGRRKPA